MNYQHQQDRRIQKPSCFVAETRREDLPVDCSTIKNDLVLLSKSVIGFIVYTCSRFIEKAQANPAKNPRAEKIMESLSRRSLAIQRYKFCLGKLPKPELVLV